LEIEINGKLIYSKTNLGREPDIDEIVEITKWGHRVKITFSLMIKDRAEMGRSMS